MAARFWVGGTGNWSDTAHWALTSGAAGGQAVPTSSDAVTFDANSGAAATVTVDVVANASSIIVNKSDLTLTLAAGLTVVGVFTFTTGTITCGSQTWAAQQFVGSGGLAKTLNLNSSTLNLSMAAGSAWAPTAGGAPMTVNAGTSTINLTGTTATFAGGSKAYASVALTGAGNATLTGTNSFVNLTRSNAAACGLILASGATQTVTGALTMSGAAGKVVTVTATTPGTPSIISIASGLLGYDYVSLKDSTATGGATFTAGLNSTNVSGNSGWRFPIGDSTTVFRAGGNVGPYLMPNGGYYTVLRTGATPLATMYKATDPTSAFTAKDAANGQNITGQSGVESVVVGSVIHFAASANSMIQYAQFDTASDTWTVKETVVASGITGGGIGVGLVVRSDGTVVIFYSDGSANCFYRIRTGVNTWSVATTVKTSASYQVTAVLGASDRVHLLYALSGAGTILHRSLSSGGVLSAEQTAASSVNTSAAVQIMGGGVALTDGGGTHIRVPYMAAAAGSTAGQIKFDSAASPVFSTEQISDGVVQSSADLALSGTTGKIYALFSRTSNNGVYYDTSSSLGGGWGTDTQIGADTAAAWRFSTNIYTRGTSLVLAYVMYNGTTVQYSEQVIGVARTFAPTQAQAVTVARTVSRSFTLTQSQQQTLVRVAQRILKLTQAQGVGYSEPITRYFKATQAQSVQYSEPIARSFGVSASQSVAFRRTTVQTQALTQAQSPALLRALGRLRALSQSSVPSRAAALARTAAVTASQAATVSRASSATLAASQSGVPSLAARTLAATRVATQAAGASVTAAVSRSVPASQSAGVTVGRSLAAERSLTQAQTPALVREASLKLALSQGASGATGYGVARTVAVAQAGSVTIVAAAGRSFSATQSASPSLTRAIATTRALSQGQAVSLSAPPPPSAAVFSVAQAGAVALAGAVSRTLHASQVQGARLVRAISTVRRVTQSALAALRPDLSSRVTASQAQTASISRQAHRRTVTATQGQALARTTAVARRFTKTQAQAVGTRRGLARQLALSQGQAASAGTLRAIVVTVSGAQAVSLTGHVTRTARVSQAAVVTTSLVPPQGRFSLTQHQRVWLEFPQHGGHISVTTETGDVTFANVPRVRVRVQRAAVLAVADDGNVRTEVRPSGTIRVTRR